MNVKTRMNAVIVIKIVEDTLYALNLFTLPNRNFEPAKIYEHQFKSVECFRTIFLI